ncbi:MAG TPA: acetyl-CoA C-acetyltransferase [Candidatus Binataceae bacterium]|nr:acetyl-CoA C-acetyltransferase [Candidatus Binataceae bacterium]
MRKAVIVSATRTAVGTFGGAFSATSATELGAIAVREAIKRAGIQPGHVDEVILGNVLPGGLGLNPARISALKAGVPQEVGSYTINKACGSGLKAVALAAGSVCCGEADAVVAGGMENMTLAPYLLKKARFGYRMGDDQIFDSMIADGLNCPITLVHMGVTAENIAAKYGVSRREQDEFAADSQARYFAAQRAGKFQAEITPVEIKRGKETVLLQVDEHPRETSADQIAGLKPAFKKDGTVTPANASGINDGAAAVVVMAREKALELGLKPLATIRSYASAGVDPAFMGMGPVPAVEKALRLAGLRRDDIGLWELNEAFAAQSLGVLRELKLPRERVNVNGGSIAIGHPVGASGARILTTLLNAMADRGQALGVATLCIGGGQGIAMVVERER